MTKTIKDRIAKSVKKSTKTNVSKKKKLPPVDWYAKSKAAIAISGTAKPSPPTVIE
jgi:hypothetical protein